MITIKLATGSDRRIHYLLAHTHGDQMDNVIHESRSTVTSRLEVENFPALLVSYVYLKSFLKSRAQCQFRNWELDSGAFSAYNSGIEINLDDYIAICKKLMTEDEKLVEIFALDVIGDWKASLNNCEKMWKAGIPAIPTYHGGEPEHVLMTIAREYPKIAIGGVAGVRSTRKMAVASQVFARVWPKQIHGFGYGSEKTIIAFPWHSVDATTWEVGPCKYGRWNTFGNMSVRGSHQNLRAEIEWYLKLELRARRKWHKQMTELKGKEMEGTAYKEKKG